MYTSLFGAGYDRFWDNGWDCVFGYVFVLITKDESFPSVARCSLLLLFFFFFFHIGMTASATEAAFQLCPDIHVQYFPVLQLGGWGNGSKVPCPRKQQ